MIDERWIEEDLEGSGRGLIEVLSRHLPGGHERSISGGSQTFLVRGAL
jgi:hypothetical protein